MSIAGRLAQSPVLRAAVGNTGWLVADRVLRLGLGLVVGLLLARYLGPRDYGVYSFAFAFVALFAHFSRLGLDEIVIRDLVRGEEHGTLGSAFALKLAGGAVGLAAAAAGILVLRPGDHLAFALVVIIGAGALFQAFDVADLWYQAKVRSRDAVLARGLAFVAASAATLAAIFSRAPLTTFAWIQLGQAALAGIGLALVFRLTGPGIPLLSARWPRARELLGQGWPLFLSGLSIMVYMRIDQVMLGQMAGPEAVGVYSAAVRVSEVWYFLPSAIVASSFPALLRSRDENPALYHDRLARLFSLMALLAYAVAVPMTFLSTPLVRALFGEPFAAAGPILAVHVWAAVFIFQGVVQGTWNVAEGYLTLVLTRTLMGAGVNVGLNLLFIPRWGGMGAAVATVISQAVASWGANLFDRRTRGIFLAQARALLFPFAGLVPVRPPASGPPPGALLARRVLVIRTDLAGDLVLSSAFLRELRKNLPLAWITLVVHPRCLNLAETCPYANEVLAHHYRDNWGRQVLLFARLRLRGFQLALLPRRGGDQNHGSLLLRASGASARAGCLAGNPRLTHAMPDDGAPRHEAEHDLAFLEWLGARVEDRSLELWLTDEDRTWADKALAGVQAAGAPLVALGVGAGAPEREWPAAFFAQAARELADSPGAAIVVVGGPGDAGAGERVLRGLGDRALNLAGRTTLRQAGAVLARCRLFIGNDSGPLHLACAAGVPAVEISRVPEGEDPLHPGAPERFGPRGVPFRVLRPRAGGSVIGEIGVDEVLMAARELLDEKGRA